MSLIAKSKDCQMDFNIGQVANILGLKIRRRTPSGVDVDCPFCGHTHKMNIHVGKNVYHCNYCGKGGGMLDLYRDVKNLSSRREAFQALSMRRGTESEWEKTVLQYRGSKKTESKLASPEEIDRTYRAMLEHLDLQTLHYENLINRGLNAGQIEKHMYRSTPSRRTEEITSALLRTGCILKGVPGFYMDSKGIWQLNLYPKLSGILIPVRSIEGFISGFQIRLDRPLEKRKYVWLSSVNKTGGVSSGSPPHYVGETDNRVVYITEGSLKADIAHELLGRSFGAIAGVSQYGSLCNLFRSLKERGTEVICEAYDIDKYSNPNVEAARQKMFEIARKEFGFKVYTVTWNSEYKGIDDWALARKLQKYDVC